MITYGKNQYFKYSELSSVEKKIYFKSIYRFLGKLVLEYPGFSKWYNRLFTDNFDLNKDREIIICESNYLIAGVSILKSDEHEKKICTLRVDKKFKRQGIGTKLIELSREWLEEDYPIITMHKMKQKEFSSILNYYGFQLEQEQKHYYNIFSTELVYNGILPEKKLMFNKIELLDIEELCRRFIQTDNFDFNKFLEECLAVWYKREYNKRIIMQY